MERYQQQFHTFVLVWKMAQNEWYKYYYKVKESADTYLFYVLNTYVTTYFFV